MTGQIALAGTKLQIGLTQQAPARDQRPESVFIFDYPELLVRRALKKLGLGPKLVTELPLFPCRGDKTFVSMTDPWPLMAPDIHKGRRRLVCSIGRDPEQVAASIVSVGARTVQRKVDGKPLQAQIKGGFDIVGNKTEINVQRGTIWSDTFEVTAAIDPDLRLTVILPNNGMEDYLWDYCRQLGKSYGMKPDLIRREMLRVNPWFLDRGLVTHRETLIGIAARVSPRFVRLGDDGPSSVTVSLEISALGTYAPTRTIAAIRAEEVETGQQVVSDFFMVNVLDDPLSQSQPHSFPWLNEPDLLADPEFDPGR